MSRIFSRYSSPLGRTFALRTFNKCETEINRHFWSFKVISDYAGYIARQQKQKNPAAITTAVFNATGPDAHRIPATVSDWLLARDELENWLRLSSLVSASSYLEVYLRQVVLCSIMSHPCCRFGSTRAVDGTFFLKARVEIPYERDLERVTKGDWAARFAAFRDLFEDVPQSLSPHISILEKVRKIRNSFAHGFGRDLDVPSPISMIGPTTRISHNTLLKHLGVLSKAAESIDKFLLAKFIGAFEVVYFYHEWKARPLAGKEKSYTPVRALKRALHRDAGLRVTDQYCADLVSYYDSVQLRRIKGYIRASK
jgi:hypothetical protein